MLIDLEYNNTCKLEYTHALYIKLVCNNVFITCFHKDFWRTSKYFVEKQNKENSVKKIVDSSMR